MTLHITPESTGAVDAAITSRRAVRAFLPTPVPRQTVEDILRVASRAPSGVNTQPWKVTVLTGRAKDELSRKISAAHDANAAAGSVGADAGEYDYYPTEWVPPYIERRRKIGWDLYGLLGIAKGDKPRMHAQHGRNYRFFGAPVGMIFTIDAHAAGSQQPRAITARTEALREEQLRPIDHSIYSTKRANALTGTRSVTSRFSGADSSAQPSDMPQTTISP